MEIGTCNDHRRTLTKAERQYLWKNIVGAYFCKKPNAGHVARDCPMKKKTGGQQGN